MIRPLGLLAALVLLSGIARADAPPDLPVRVSLKTETESFTSRHYVAVRDGRLWFKANEETTGTKEAWQLLGNGLPEGEKKKPFAVPNAIRSISADGDNLIAISDEGRVYYMKWSTRKWVDDWGLPPFRKAIFANFDHRGVLQISHRGPDNHYYEDIEGRHHPVSAGVTTYYALSSDGRELSYADPWLPPEFSHYVCPPRRGRFTAEAMSASASTLFVIDRAGEMWTRLADFDVTGENPILPYSYVAGPKLPNVRRLPGPDWKQQPAIPGKHTTRITVLQNGEGNAARELRVEGIDDAGRGGYWTKPIDGETWAFVTTGAAVPGPFVDPALPLESRLGPSLEHAFHGTATVKGIKAPLTARLADYNARCSPYSLVLEKAGVSLPLALHTRAVHLSHDGAWAEFRAALLAPEADVPAPLQPVVAKIFGKKMAIDAEFAISSDVAHARLKDGGLAATFEKD